MNSKNMFIVSLIIALVFVNLSFAEVNGTLNQTNVNPITGLYGYTKGINSGASCSNSSDCYSGYCYSDYAGGKYCSSSSSNCVHKLSGDDNASNYDNGVYAPGCKDSTHRWKCSEGTWEPSSCSSGYECKANAAGAKCVNTTSPTSSQQNKKTCTPEWICEDSTHACYRNSTCSCVNLTLCEYGCKDGKCNSAPESVNISISFTSIPSNFSVLENSSKSFNVVVKNTGDVKLDKVGLSVSGLSNISISVTPTNMNLSSGGQGSFSILINATSLSFGKRVLTLKVFNGSDSSNISDSKQVVLYILPTNSSIANINETLKNVTDKISMLEKEISKKKKEGYNTSYAEINLKNLKENLNKTEELIKDGNYISAYNLLEDMQTNLKGTENILSVLQKPKGHSTIVIFIIVILVGITMAVIYFMWPKKGGYQYGYGYRPKNENKFNSFFNDLINKYKRWKLMKKLEKEEKKYKYKYKV